jgi:hypothetical protein
LNDKKIEHILEKLAKDSSWLKDFGAGVEPTGVFTFRNAYLNKKNHSKHRMAGDIGGFAGGAALSTVMGAAGLAGVGAVLKRTKHGNLGHALWTGAKDSLMVFNPSKAIKALKRLPSGMQLATRQNNLANRLDDTATSMNKMRTYSSQIPPRDVVNKAYGEAASLSKDRAAFEAKHGVNSIEAVRQGMAIVGGSAAAGLGGGLNALSAHAQYNQGRQARLGKLLPKDLRPKHG